MIDIKKIGFFTLAFAIRILFVYIADLMDKSESCLNYTDTDYDVFSDAATHVRNGFGSPYARKTYRYTPLVAYMCTLNNFYHPVACKVVFCVLDLFGGIILESMSNLQLKSATPQKGRCPSFITP